MTCSEHGILTPDQQEDLDERIARHKKGESKSYSWLEVRAQIEKASMIDKLLIKAEVILDVKEALMRK